MTSLRIFSAVGVEVEQDAGGDALVLAHQAEQDVLRADVVVAERQRLAQRQLEHLLGARREGDLAGGDLLAGADDAHDLGAHPLDGDVERLEHARGETLLLAQQAEQDVLRADVVVLERARLLLRENDDLPGPFCESLEHGVRPSCADRAPRAYGPVAPFRQSTNRVYGPRCRPARRWMCMP